jgi:dolichyl-phosphate-mannose-protein mannosyltransferase
VAEEVRVSISEPSTMTRSRDAAVLAALAAANLVLHFACNGRYGYWIDELYFIACGRHLAWGYVDQPPLIAFAAAASRAALGDSLFAIRFLPALTQAALVFLTGWMARHLGGGRFAQVLAALAVFVAPVYLAFGNLLTMNAFEPLLWTACMYLVMVIIDRDRPGLWLLIGLIAGIGLLNKHAMGFFGVALIAGLLLTPQRRILQTAWIGAAAAATAVIVLPHVWWQWQHGWPTIELLQNAKRYQHQPVTPLEFLWGQVQLVHPVALPLWLAGLFFYFLSADGRRFRFAGWTFVLLFGVGLVTQAKTYYLAPIYATLFAAGGVATERFAARRQWQWLKPATIALLLIGGAVTVPFVLPVLPIEMMPRYLEWLGMREVRPERRAEGDVPQLFADMLGWEETVAAVARAYDSLPPEERTRAAIWGASYGDAGAVDFFGPAHGLPPAISGHQNYYLWGPGSYSGDVLIAVNISPDHLRPWCARLDEVTTVDCRYCMPDRRRMPITLCRGLKLPLHEFWPQVKCWTCDVPEFARQP